MKFSQALIIPLAALGLLLAGSFSGRSAGAGTNHPNILFILVDDMGWGDLGVFYQNSRGFATNRNKPAFATPRLDTLALEGLQLRRHYCPAPVCAPSRASLLLGVHQGHANVRDNEFDKALENNHTLATVMRQAGYETAGFGKWGLQGSGAPPEAHPQYRGFDCFFGYMTHLNGHHHYPKEAGQLVWDGLDTNISARLDKCYTTDLWTARAKKWIIDHEATNAAKPFFIYLAYETPHAQLQVPAAPYPAGGGTNGGVQWTGVPGPMINTALGRIDSWIHPDYTNATWDSDNDPTTAEVAWPEAEKRHATMMRRLDDAVGDLEQLLKDLKIETNTLVVFTSDNGPHNESGDGGRYTQNPRFFGSFGPMDGIKRDTWEGGMREPTLVWWPGHVPAGTTNTSPSQFQDWMPTFAELGGVPPPARTDGVSLVPTLIGSGVQRQSTIYVEYNFHGTTPKYTEFETSRRGATRNDEQIIYLDGYKGIRYNVTSSSNDFQIYDTLSDMKETTDLAGVTPYFTNLQQRMKDRVLQVRRPGGGVSRPYDADLVPSVSVTNTTGLNWQAFEGNFPWVPDFASLTAVSNGQCSGLDLSKRTRDDNIGLLFTGYLEVPKDGTYTLYLNCDGRSFLRIHDASVIDADFGYSGGAEVSASIRLKAGCHPIRLGYVRGSGGTPSLSLQWSSAAITRQTVPLSALVRERIPRFADRR
jgi:arylsulfatase A-like enzyme